MELKCPEIPDYDKWLRQQKSKNKNKTRNSCSNLVLGLTAPDIRRNLKIMVPNPDIPENYPLPNGDKVGQFSVKYILHLDQKSLQKRKNK